MNPYRLIRILNAPPVAEPLIHARIDSARMRLLAVIAVFSLAFCVIGLRLVDLAVLKHDRTVHNVGVTAVNKPIKVRRDIVDRNGNLLATTLNTASVFADPLFVRHPEETARKLVSVLPGLAYGEALRKLQGSGRFAYIARDVSPKRQYAVNALGLTGIDFIEEERRVYPTRELFSHIIGYTDIDNHGLAGIEYSFDTLLSEPGAPLRLSLNMALQYALRDEIAGVMDHFRAKAANGLIMDARSGELLAMVSLPDFDPHHPADADKLQRFNRNTLGVYEMGSTFKILNAAMALDSGAIDLTETVDTTDPIHVGGFTIDDFFGKHRPLTLPEIIMYSSNIGSTRVAMRAGKDTQRDFMKRAGLLDPSQVELPEVGAPIVPSPWRDINTMTIAFGHGLAVSPLQMASAITAVINGGILHSPSLVKRPEDTPPEGIAIISPQTSLIVRKLMRIAVTRGTGHNADVSGFFIGGKTGTSNKVVAGCYDNDFRLASFVGAFPMDDPQYVVLAMVDEPQGTDATGGWATGGWVAAPLVGRMIARMSPIVGAWPRDPTAPAIVNTLSLVSEGVHLASD
ncbi:MAG: penicillin-binding protein 2 [Pseudomonadota bacterium]|nr:penicillin-binding protein 2 [Pseudomonadota bacterium]